MTTPRLLGGRYELGETIGVGGMAEVFYGRDVRLGREVAVKVLRADLAREPSFQARFRREAQAAASLNAPCIVSVYDTGEDGAVPWIVMEYVAGRTLREVLQSEGRLLPQRALEVTADVLSALEVAHASGIVHRDIKPANVMLTDAGEVKVMDFGIARAVADTSSTMTQTAAVIGTAAYLSPEQARGEHVDARSDVYSTGCLLYELITGGPPFTGDSPVAVAYQHVREDPVPPSEYDDTLGPDVDAVVLQAMAKNPANRYQSAAEMRDDLLRAAAGEPVAALPFAGAGAYAATPMVSTATVLRPPEDRRRKRAVVYSIFGLVLLGVIVALALVVNGLLSTKSGLVPAPDLVGLSRQAALNSLAAQGLQLGDETEQFSEETPGSVVRQTPDAGIVLNAGGAVDIVVSKGVEMTVVPQVLQQSQAEATAILEDAKLKVGEVIMRDGNIAAGTVLDVLPRPGTQVRAGTTVKLVVSSGKVPVPDVRGKTSAEAVAALQAAGFSVGLMGRDSAGPVGIVLDQTPVLVTAPRGSTVVLGISQVPAPPSPTPSPSASPSPLPSDTASPTPAPTDTATPSPTP